MKFSPAIQYLRALAAIGVLCYHVILKWGILPRSDYMLLAGGVDIFFVISGFVMWGVTSGREGGSWDFFSRRLKRIVPLYWLMTTVMLLTLVIDPAAGQSSRLELWHVVSSYLFVPSLHPVKGVFEPLLFPGWTLNYEMAFYILFAGALLGPSRWRLVLVMVPLIALMLVGLLPHSKTSLVEFYCNTMLFEFAAGCALGAAMTATKPITPPAWTAALMIVLGVVLAVSFKWTPTWPRGLAWGIPAALFVSGWVFLERSYRPASVRFFLLLGDASYSIYLSHVIVLSAAFQAVHRMAQARGAVGEILASAILVAICTVSGVALYWLVERPLIAWFKGPPLKVALAPAE